MFVFLCVHTLRLSQVAACPPAFAVLHLWSNPRWNKEHMGAVFKFPHCWLKLKLSPTSFLLSVFKHCPIPHPLPFECGAIPPEQAAPINLKISIRKKKRTTKTNRGWGERRRKTWNKVCVQWWEGDHDANCVMVGRPWSAWSTVDGKQGNMLPHTVLTRLPVRIAGESSCGCNFHVKVMELYLNHTDEEV